MKTEHMNFDLKAEKAQRRKRTASTQKKSETSGISKSTKIKRKTTPTATQLLSNQSSTSSSAPQAAVITTAVRPSVIGVARSISACHRCRLRKTRCDQNFPSCAACLKAGVECVGIDAATGRQIPRSYVSHLEDRVAMLELQIQKLTKGQDIAGSDIIDIPQNSSDSNNSQVSSLFNQSNTTAQNSFSSNTSTNNNILNGTHNTLSNSQNHLSNGLAKNGVSGTKPEEESTGVEGLMSTVKMVSSKAATSAPSSFLGSSSGLSFARLLLTAIKFKEKNSPDHNSHNTANASTFSQSKHEAPKIQPASLPSKETAEKFLYLFFSQANSQLPVIHREQFLTNYFIPIYGPLSEGISLASDYTTIGVPLTPSPASSPADPRMSPLTSNSTLPPASPNSNATLGNNIKSRSNSGSMYGTNTPIAISNYNAPQVTPETPKKALYFLHLVFAIASSIHHQTHPAHISESFRVAAMQYLDNVLASTNRLEALQGILLLALYSIMRPAVPGIWYVLGWALRLCVDLGLHTEAGLKSSISGAPNYNPFTLDLRRRLFWCTYAIDRQVCVYLGRPFGIPEESIKVPFPSLLDDTLIMEDDSSDLNDIQIDTSRKAPSYKIISLSFFRIRKIQSEIQRILYDCAPLPREYETLEQWRTTMGQRLETWHASCPKSAKKMNCNFNLAFIELNYNQTRLLLYGPTPSDSPEPKEAHIHIIADAGKKVIQHYMNLHRHKSINYTWVAVHNLFTAGTSYLYALYHSPALRAATPVEEIDHNAHSCAEVLHALEDRCDAAASCRSTFELLTAAILKMCTQERNSLPQNDQRGSILVNQNQLQPQKKMQRNLEQPQSILKQRIQTDVQFQNQKPQDAQFQTRLCMQDYGSQKMRQQDFSMNNNSMGQSSSPILVPQKSLPVHSSALQPQISVNNNSNNLSNDMTSIDSKRGSAGSNSSFLEELLGENFNLDEFFQEAGLPIYPDNMMDSQGITNETSKPQQDLTNGYSNMNLSIQQTDSNTTNGSVNSTSNSLVGLQQEQDNSNQTFNGSFQQQKINLFNNDILSPDFGMPINSNMNNGPRVFDLINEVPMAAIWDQYFAPSNNIGGAMMNPHGDWQNN